MKEKIVCRYFGWESDGYKVDKPDCFSCPQNLKDTCEYYQKRNPSKNKKNQKKTQEPINKEEPEEKVFYKLDFPSGPWGHEATIRRNIFNPKTKEMQPLFTPKEIQLLLKKLNLTFCNSGISQLVDIINGFPNTIYWFNKKPTPSEVISSLKKLKVSSEKFYNCLQELDGESESLVRAELGPEYELYFFANFNEFKFRIERLKLAVEKTLELYLKYKKIKEQTTGKRIKKEDRARLWLIHDLVKLYEKETSKRVKIYYSPISDTYKGDFFLFALAVFKLIESKIPELFITEEALGKACQRYLQTKKQKSTTT
jgi:hypothetical protein